MEDFVYKILRFRMMYDFQCRNKIFSLKNKEKKGTFWAKYVITKEFEHTILSTSQISNDVRC